MYPLIVPSYQLTPIPLLVQPQPSLLAMDPDFQRGLPISLYDSGLGVLLGALAIKRVLPHEVLHCFIQNSVGRFGDKPLCQIAALVGQDCQRFAEAKAAALICNSACVSILTIIP